MLKPILILNGTTIDDFIDLLEKRFNRSVDNESSIQNISQALEYVNDFQARCILSGNPEKPISKKVFNSLRRVGKITTYHPSEGRTSYKVSELYTYIESTKTTNHQIKNR